LTPEFGKEATMDAEVGQWSARRRRVNEKIAEEQAASVVIGYTEQHDDGLTVEDWGLILNGKAGQLAQQLMTHGTSLDRIEQTTTELAALSHSFLESLDRRRGNS
jgi:hypothetical protein